MDNFLLKYLDILKILLYANIPILIRKRCVKIWHNYLTGRIGRGGDIARLRSKVGTVFDFFLKNPKKFFLKFWKLSNLYLYLRHKYKSVIRYVYFGL